ncbi:MAG: BACON domain-containing protein [Alistipes sp.]|nr:BACON domain-containing protein [Alistipes sp.]
MTFNRLFTCVAIATLALLLGCDDKVDDTTNSGDATFSLDKTEFSFPAAGGDATVEYTITNPVQGGVVLTNCEASWIKNLSTATYGSIKFDVAPNYTDKVRETTIDVTYTGANGSHHIKVTQEASTDALFSYKVVYKAPRELTIKITPADKETAYVCGIRTEEYINSFKLQSDVALFNDHIQALNDEAQRKGQSLMNYLQNVSYTGVAEEVLFDELIPATSYVVFSYHIDLTNAQIIGDIYREVIRSGEPEKVDVELDMTLEVKNNTINQIITSSDEEAYYYTSYWKVDDFYSYYAYLGDPKMEEVFPAKWNETVVTQLSFGKSVNEILDELCHRGSKSIENSGLANYTDYAFFLFAVDPVTGFVASEPIIQQATTTSAVDSGVVIEITVEDIFATTANVYWTADTEGATFARGFLTKNEYNTLGSNDEERFATFRQQSDKYSFYVATTETDMNLYNLTPNTTYVAFAYGVDGETPNTRIYTKEFTTLSGVAGQSNINMSWSEHYNAAEVAALDVEHWGDYATKADHAIIPMTISGVTTGDDVYIMLSTFSIDYYGQDDSQWLRDLVSNEANKVDCYAHYNIVAKYEYEYVLVAVAKDANGNYGQLLKKEIYLYESDSATADSYVYVENE